MAKIPSVAKGAPDISPTNREYYSQLGPIWNSTTIPVATPTENMVTKILIQKLAIVWYNLFFVGRGGNTPRTLREHSGTKTHRGDLPFNYSEKELEEAVEKAVKLEQSSVINVFQSSEFEENKPFPSLETLKLSYYICELDYRERQNIVHKIYSIMHSQRRLTVSPEFYSLFLDKTSTLRSLKLLRKYIYCFYFQLIII